MGHSTSSGRTSGDVTRAPMSQQMIDDAINRASGRALISADVDRLERELELNAAPGDVIEAQENNRWHDITLSYTRLENGMWHYDRTNNDTGEKYENSDVTARRVASDVLGTGTSANDPTRWSVRRSGDSERRRRNAQVMDEAVRRAQRRKQEERRRGREAARNMENISRRRR